jgi:hypothetical protein
VVAGDPDSITGKEIRRHPELIDRDDPWRSTWWRLLVARTTIFVALGGAFLWSFGRGNSAWSEWSGWLEFGIPVGIAAIASFAIILTRCPRCGRHFAANLEMGNIFTGKCLHCGLRQWSPALPRKPATDESSQEPQEGGSA